MQDITSALSWRYATKIFDATKKVSDTDLATILESGRLAPSAFGVEPWHFFVVENPELRAKLRDASYGQPKVTDASHIIVIARRTDVRANMTNETITRAAKTMGIEESMLGDYRAMIEGGIAAKDDRDLDAWTRSQTYIPLGTMIAAASLLNIDNCPMEGFNPADVDSLLGLSEKHLTATTMLAVGYRGEDPAAARPKVRQAKEEVTTFIK